MHLQLKSRKKKQSPVMGAPSAVGADPLATAEAGLQGPGRQLPHADRIQRSFGGHDISGVRAHSGDHADAAMSELGARAYATGEHVAFGRDVDLHTAAHEAAHVVQQRQGIAGGAEWEAHADAVADRVVAGESAEGMLSGIGGGAATTGVQLDALNSAQSADELIASGKKVKPTFDEFLTAFGAESNADYSKHKVAGKAKNEDGSKKTKADGSAIYVPTEKVLSGAAPLKGKARIEQKVKQKYDGKYGKVIDVVRGTLAYKTCKDLMKAIKGLKKAATAAGHKVVRAKEGFSEIDKAVYGDVKANIEVDGHICELQMNHTEMLKGKATKSGHGAYEVLRDTETEWIEATGAKALPKMRDLYAQSLGEGKHAALAKKCFFKVQKAVHASHAAYDGARVKMEAEGKDYTDMVNAARELAGKGPLKSKKRQKIKRPKSPEELDEVISRQDAFYEL